jgi:cytochrome c oxidase subunit IV
MSAHAKEEHQSHTKEYMIIFVLLAVFTLIELWIPSIKSLSQFAKGVGLTAMACIKAWMVAYFYMHLKDEKLWMKIIALVPISAVLFAYVLVVETMYR